LYFRQSLLFASELRGRTLLEESHRGTLAHSRSGAELRVTRNIITLFPVILRAFHHGLAPNRQQGAVNLFFFEQKCNEHPFHLSVLAQVEIL
jgi:hypothetical protein